MAITRRRFLQGMGAAGAAAGFAACGPSHKLIQPPTPRPSSPILVVVDLDGGNDWLNMMVPTSGANRSAYEALRPRLALPISATSSIGGGVGLSSDFVGMDHLANLGRIAWIPGIGMNNPNLSHFVSIDLWGQGSARPDGTGWLGRFADDAFAPGDVLRGISVTSDLPVMLRGASHSFVSIANSNGYLFPASLTSGALSSPWNASLLESQTEVANAAGNVDPAAAPEYGAAAGGARLFLEAQKLIAGGLPDRQPSVLYPGDPGYPTRRLDGRPLDGYLSNQLKLVAQMIAADVPGEIYFTRISGWDTHANQAVDHPNLLRTLGGSLTAFYNDLQSIDTPSGNAQDRTMVLVWSEFGRRVHENDGGTDHGTAGLAFCLGRGVRGGIYGDYPNLSDLDGNGNMKYTVDFRRLYATALQGWLGRTPTESDAILLQGAAQSGYASLGFV